MSWLAVAVVAILAGTPAAADGIYDNLRNGRDEPCCNTADCAPIGDDDLRRGEGGLEARIDGVWWPVGPPGDRDSAILDDISRDGRIHACHFGGQAWIRCLMLPGDV